MGFEFYCPDILLKGSFKLPILYRYGCAGAVMLMELGTAGVGQDHLEDTPPCHCRTESNAIC